MFAFAGPGKLEGLLGDAGFLDVEVGAVDVEMVYADVDDYLAITNDCSRPFADAMASIDAAARAEVAKETAQALEPFRAEGGGLRVPGADARSPRPARDARLR